MTGALNAEPRGAVAVHLRGRARFNRDRGAIKDAGVQEQAAALIEEMYDVLDRAIIALRNRDQSEYEAAVVAAGKIVLAKARGEM